MAQSSAGVKATHPPQWLEVNGLRAVTELLLREKGEKTTQNRREGHFHNLPLTYVFKLSYDNEQNQVNINISWAFNISS